MEQRPVLIRNLLLTTDFSPSSALALPYAGYLAEHLDAELYVVHVIANPLSPLYGPAADDYATIVSNARSRAGELMAAYEAGLGAAVKPHILIREGEAVAEILAVIRERHIDTVVMASHGEGALRHFLLGSTAQKVLHSARCPVYIIRNSPTPPAQRRE
jgi:nucleotide-binding universal stress UspA family protein